MRRHPAFQDLSRDHFGALNRVLEVRRVAQGDPYAKDEDAVCRSFLELAQDVLPDHFDEEEALLLPELATPEREAHGRRLQEEHKALRRGFGPLRAGAGIGPFWKAAQALQAHIRWEEGVLFEAMQTWLSEADLQTLGRRSLAFREARGRPVGPGTGDHRQGAGRRRHRDGRG